MSKDFPQFNVLDQIRGLASHPLFANNDWEITDNDGVLSIVVAGGYSAHCHLVRANYRVTDFIWSLVVKRLRDFADRPHDVANVAAIKMMLDK